MSALAPTRPSWSDRAVPNWLFAALVSLPFLALLAWAFYPRSTTGGTGDQPVPRAVEPTLGAFAPIGRDEAGLPVWGSPSAFALAEAAVALRGFFFADHRGVAVADLAPALAAEYRARWGLDFDLEDPSREVRLVALDRDRTACVTPSGAATVAVRDRRGDLHTIGLTDGAVSRYDRPAGSAACCCVLELGTDRCVLTLDPDEASLLRRRGWPLGR